MNIRLKKSIFSQMPEFHSEYMAHFLILILSMITWENGKHSN